MKKSDFWNGPHCHGDPTIEPLRHARSRIDRTHAEVKEALEVMEPWKVWTILCPHMEDFFEEIEEDIDALDGEWFRRCGEEIRAYVRLCHEEDSSAVRFLPDHVEEAMTKLAGALEAHAKSIAMLRTAERETLEVVFMKQWEDEDKASQSQAYTIKCAPDFMRAAKWNGEAEAPGGGEK